jgi:hypothetical protein
LLETNLFSHIPQQALIKGASVSFSDRWKLTNKAAHNGLEAKERKEITRTGRWWVNNTHITFLTGIALANRRGYHAHLIIEAYIIFWS